MFGKRLLRCIGIILPVLVLSCAVMQKPEPGTNFGPPPNNIEQALRSHFETILIDAESARYQIGRPVRAYANDGLIYGGRVGWIGWKVPVLINAKNRMGGYTGYKPFIILFNGDYVFKHFEGEKHVMVHAYQGD